MIAKAARYDVQYLVAGSPNFVRVVGDDPRWRKVLATSHVTLFEAVGREPALAEAPGWQVRVASQRYLRGGGYEYALDATRAAGGGPAGSLLVKTGWSPAWRAWSGDRELAVTSTDDALVSVALPEGVDHASVTLRWDISDLRAKGDRISLAALALAFALLLYGTRRKVPAPALPDGVLQWVGLGGAAGWT
jgi:hypothetical protein